ncbi:MAG TPA: c-type cytochrome [Anaeromyxobacter sp.]
MRKFGLLVAFAAAACSSKVLLPHSAQGEPVLEVRGAIREGPHSLGVADLERLPRLKVRGTDPRTGETTEWEGPSVAALVSDHVDLNRGADTAVIRTADGAAIPVPLTVIRTFRPVLADRAGGTRIGTAVVAWPTDAQRGLATDPRANAWWAREVVAFEIVSWQRTYGTALAPPEGAADAARRGADVYVESCIGCHQIRGAGGTKGPDLSTVAQRIRGEAFLGLLTRHPGSSERQSRDTFDAWQGEVWAFLGAMAALPPPEAPQGEVTAEGAPKSPPVKREAGDVAR